MGGFCLRQLQLRIVETYLMTNKLKTLEMQ